MVVARAVIFGSTSRRRIAGSGPSTTTGTPGTPRPRSSHDSAPPPPEVVTPKRIDVPLADRVPGALPAEGAPDGWTLKEFSGRAEIDLRQTDGRLALHLRSDRASFALYRDVLVDLERFPLLTWSWKVALLPAGGDIRSPGRNDQAAQLYVIFPRWPSPLTHSDVIGYVWDTTAPVGTQTTSPQAANVRVIVVESGRRGIGAWLSYERNVVEDYTALFGGKPPRAGKIAVMIDSNNTRSGAEALVTSIAFLAPPAGR